MLLFKVSHKSQYEVHLLSFGQWCDSVVQEQSEKLWAQPLLTSTAITACTATHDRRLSQSQHSEGRVDGKDWPGNRHSDKSTDGHKNNDYFSLFQTDVSKNCFVLPHSWAKGAAEYLLG